MESRVRKPNCDTMSDRRKRFLEKVRGVDCPLLNRIPFLTPATDNGVPLGSEGIADGSSLPLAPNGRQVECHRMVKREVHGRRKASKNASSEKNPKEELQ